MVSFTVHEPPNPPADRVARGEGLVFVGDGFAWGAALLGPLWLALQQAWRELALWGAAAGVLAGGIHLAGLGNGWIAVVLAALAVVIGFEAGDVERERLSAQGWSEIGVAEGKSLAAAERDFFERWLGGGEAGASRRRSSESGGDGGGVLKGLLGAFGIRA